MLHLDSEDNSEGQVQVKEACAPLLKTNLKEDEHKPENVKEMVAPSPKKMAKFCQTSQHKEEQSAAQLKKRSKLAETFDEDNEFLDTKGQKRQQPD